MEQKVLTPLNIQRFADNGEEENANQSAEEAEKAVENTTEKTEKQENSKESKKETKTYSDEEVNAISMKNSDKARKDLLKELGITDIDEAKEIISKAYQEKEKNKSVDEKTQEAIERAEKSAIEAANAKIENALLRKNVKDSKISRAVRLIDKKEILNSDGSIDESKLNTEVDDLLKDFPELISKTEEEKKGFKIGGDGKEDQKDDEMENMRKVMGLK